MILVLYVLVNKANVEVWETTDYLEAVHYTIVHPNCTIRKFYVIAAQRGVEA